MKKSKWLLWLLTLVLLPLHTAGCSNSDNGDRPASETATNETVIYEAFPGFYGTSNTLSAITGQLDNIKALGTNVLWLMPVYEQGVLKAFGSPYAVKNYKAVNPDYGTLADLKALVSAAHGKEMKVILDWVANHTSWDNAWIENRSWYTQDANGNIISPPGFNWTDVADLNYDNTDMRAAMLEAMKYWITEANIDGYRCDYAEGVPSDFWQTAIKELRTLKGDGLFMLAESGDSKFFADGFDMVYGWEFATQLAKVYAGSATLDKLYETHKAEYADVPAGKQRMRYITNHDLASEHSPITTFNGERGAISAYVIAATLGGAPMIYSSQEIGYPNALSFFTNRALDWSSNPAYRSEYEQIMSVRKASAPLKTGTLKTYGTGKLASFARSTGNETVLVMVNTTNAELSAKIPIEQAGNTALDLMNNNASVTVPATLIMEPYQYVIWNIQQ